MSLKDYSTTAASNTSAPPNGAPEGMTLANVNNVIRQVMADIRTLAAADTIAAASTTDIGSKDATILTLTGTATTISALGTVSAGIYKFIIYNAAHTLTYNATSLMLIGNSNRTVAAGDVSLFVSEGSGNWRELFYSPDTGYQPLDADLTAIAALTTTSFGRGLLESADAATLFAAIKQAASETATGVVEAATTAEMTAGTAGKFPDAEKVKAHVEGYAKTRVSANDTTPGYLNGKLVAGTNVTLTEGSDGGNETLTIAAAGGVSADVGAGGVSSIAVGAFALMCVNIGSVLSGNTIAGSSLLYAAITSSSGAFATGGTPPGTWRNLTASSLQGGFIDIGIFQRIA